MVKRSGPLGLCFLEVARPPRQPGSSLRWGCDGGVSCLWPPHMSNAKQQDISLSEIGQSELCARVQACTRVHTHTHTHTHTSACAGRRRQCRNPCLCLRSGPQPGCDHLLLS
jgi:hypothetical protein